MVTARTAAGGTSKILTPTARRYTFHDPPGLLTGGFFGRVTFKNTVSRTRCRHRHATPNF